MSQTANSEASAAAKKIVIVDVPGVFEVYIDGRSLEVCYEPGEMELSPACRAFLSRAKLKGAAPTPCLKGEYQLAFKRMVGEAMALAIRGDLQSQQDKANAAEWLVSAKELLASADKFLADRTGETARMWYVQATVIMLVLLFCLFPLLNLTVGILEGDKDKEVSKSGESKTPAGSTEPGSTPATGGKLTVTAAMFRQSGFFAVRLYALAMVAGALGAGFSLLIRVADLKIDPSTGQRSHYGEVAFRLTIGALAALIILFGMEADVFAGFLKVSSENGLIDAELYSRSFWIIGVFSIAAGACESLVPNLLDQLSKSAIDKTEDKLAAESPAD